MRIFCNAKDSHIFPTKKTKCICDICIQNFKEMSTNNVVNFEQPQSAHTKGEDNTETDRKVATQLP